MLGALSMNVPVAFAVLRRQMNAFAYTICETKHDTPIEHTYRLFIYNIFAFVRVHGCVCVCVRHMEIEKPAIMVLTVRSHTKQPTSQ